MSRTKSEEKDGENGPEKKSEFLDSRVEKIEVSVLRKSGIKMEKEELKFVENYVKEDINVGKMCFM